MEELITTAQDLTSSWANLGKPISMANYRKLGLWLDVNINNSTGVLFRALPLKSLDSTATVYNFPIKWVSSSKVAIDDENFELTNNADQKLLVAMETDYLVPYVQIQVMATVVGATAGQIDVAEYNRV